MSQNITKRILNLNCVSEEGIVFRFLFICKENMSTPINVLCQVKVRKYVGKKYWILNIPCRTNKYKIMYVIGKEKCYIIGY